VMSFNKLVIVNHCKLSFAIPVSESHIISNL
jgi:hypothetical protein